MMTLLLASLLHAPLPLAAVKPKAASVVGEWVLHWKGGEGPCRFDADGGFACVWNGALWIGTWKMEEAEEGMFLSVDEHIPAKDEWGKSASAFKWTAMLKRGTREGTVLPIGEFKLRRR